MCIFVLMFPCVFFCVCISVCIFLCMVLCVCSFVCFCFFCVRPDHHLEYRPEISLANGLAMPDTYPFITVPLSIQTNHQFICIELGVLLYQAPLFN